MKKALPRFVVDSKSHTTLLCYFGAQALLLLNFMGSTANLVAKGGMGLNACGQVLVCISLLVENCGC